MRNLAIVCSYVSLKRGEMTYKVFQKTMYFIENVTPISLSYRLQNGGPYSLKLDYSVDNLELMGAVEVVRAKKKKKILPGWNAESLLEEGKELVEKYRAKMDSILDSLPGDPDELQLWASVHYVADVLEKIYGTSDETEIVKEVMRAMNWNSREERIIAVLSRMREVGLLSSPITNVYLIRPSGEIEELAFYCLPAKEALKNAWLQFVKCRLDTWNWGAIEAPIIEGRNVYSIDTPIGVLSVRK